MRYGAEKDVKLYYTISEVVDMTGVPAHILRYWEQDFTMLRPRKNRAGNRSYRERDIGLIRRIQQLLQVEGFTVDGALKHLKEFPTEILTTEVDNPEPVMASVESSIPDSVIPDVYDAKPTQVRSASERKTEILTQLREIRDLLK